MNISCGIQEKQREVYEPHNAFHTAFQMCFYPHEGQVKVRGKDRRIRNTPEQRVGVREERGREKEIYMQQFEM